MSVRKGANLFAVFMDVKKKAKKLSKIKLPVTRGLIFKTQRKKC